MALSAQVQKSIGIALNLLIFGFLCFKYVQTRDVFFVVLAVLLFFAPYLGKLMRTGSAR